MNTRFCLFTAVSIFSLALLSCPQATDEGGGTTYTVTISQPAGGTISADPTSGPAGTVITHSGTTPWTARP
ncbi:MAG: hypothetical protein LBS62_14970 [Clostridiales bacterium]|jgi:hypothetical protein|nr:hypothetical protein [Clostridiales bacterium]